MAKANLNNYVEWFEFVISSTTYRIQEPIGWRDVEISLNRNEKYHGFDLEVIGENSTLQFIYLDNPDNCNPLPGGNLIIDQYNVNGQDAVILFRFGYNDENDNPIVVYEADIDLNVYERDRKIVTVGARRISFDDLINNRFDTPVDLSKTEDVDGNPISPEPLQEVEFHSKGLFKISERETDSAWTPNSRNYFEGPIPGDLVNTEMDINNSGLLEIRVEELDNIPNGVGDNVFKSKKFYAQPSFSRVIIEDLTTNFNVPDGIGDTGVNPQWTVDEAGLLNIDLGIAWDAQIHVSDQWKSSRAKLKIEGCTRGDARMGYASIKMFLRVGSTTYTLYTNEDTNIGCGLRLHNTNRFFSGERVANFPPEYENILVKDSKLPSSVLFDSSFIDLFQSSGGSQPPIQNPGPVWTTFQTSLLVEAGDEIALWVEMYGEGDYNRNTLQASDVGWMGQACFYEEDRDVPANKSFMNITLESETPSSVVKSQLIFETGKDIIQGITGLNNRFRSSILGRTDSSTPYGTDGCASLNVVTNGFQIRDFSEGERPIITSLSEYIDSLRAIYNLGLALEEEGGVEIVKVEGIEYFYNEQEMISLDSIYEYNVMTAKELVYNEIEIGYETYVDEGVNLLDEFNTRHRYSTGIKKNKNKAEIISPYIAGGYTIELQRREQFSSAPSNSVENDDSKFIINVIRDGGGFKSLQDEGFSLVSGVYSPTTSYNLKISPKRMLYRWARWLKSSLNYKNQLSHSVRFLEAFQNKDLVTETALSCEQNGTVAESGNVVLNDFPSSDLGIYSPEWVTFKAQLRWDEFSNLKNKLRGNGGGADDYGYITIINPEGVEEKLWAYEVKYNVSRQECYFKTLRTNL